ncbi:PAS domain S-box protein [Pseudorhodoferax soli]|uniref:histidine kinase n=1 Tax=Pseudorhodoferax soli TaxID=545864 RepID=A0A368XSR3_9BURK|nr:PAS domain S-box protein [Pseudorhodoferax soli]RCW69557.1 PAS domain S-box-containing protein [Pseudorhodoferax soli]
MDSPPEPLFDLMARFAAELCGTPIALISLIDEERQWFKANVGLPGVNETPRDVAFCAHAIQSDSLLEVPNAALDPRFADNPLVTGAPDIRFYAGAPLILPGGSRAGTLCVIDRTPGHLGEREASMLRMLADMVGEALMMRRDLIRRSLSVRSKYEAALAQSEARYRALVEEQRELVALVRDRGEIVYANPAWLRYYGVDAAQAIGSNVFAFLGQDDQAMVQGVLEHVLLSGESVVCETRSTGPDGEDRWVSWSNNRQRERDGDGWLLRGVGTDITSRKRAELALRESEAFLDRTGRIARVGGWQADLATGAMRWSDETCRIHEVELGHRLSLDEAIGFLAEGDRALAEEAIRRSVAEGKPWDLELRLTTAKGKELWVRLVGDVEREGGRAVRLTGAVQDITERRTSKAELLREQTLRLQIEEHAKALGELLREREEMTQVLAHEVRQPLNNASAALQSAAAVLVDVGEQAASVRLGRAQAVMGQVLASIDNTLAGASLLARQYAVEGADTDIDTLVAVVLADMPAAERHRIRVERIATSRTVSADMSLLRLALRNLLLNALTYSPPQAPVVVRLIDSDDPLALLIEVEDKGPGFNAELVGRLFERGNRGRHPPGKPGHGLGLYIVRRVMELHGGRVELVRNTPHGSTMRLIVEQSLDD